MKSDLESQRAAILDLVDQERYSEALTAIEASSIDLTKNGRILIAKADCFYELGKDVEALEIYVCYLKLFPRGRGKNFCLIGASVCLKNLDLQQEALSFLERVDDDHEGKQKELEHSREILEKQQRAQKVIRNYPANPE